MELFVALVKVDLAEWNVGLRRAPLRCAPWLRGEMHYSCNFPTCFAEIPFVIVATRECFSDACHVHECTISWLWTATASVLLGKRNEQVNYASTVGLQLHSAHCGLA